MKGKVPDFVQKKGSSVCLLEQADTRLLGVGERSFLVAKQLALEKVCRNCSAVHNHEGFVGPRSAVVYGASDDVFAGTRLSADEYRDIAMGHYAGRFFEGRLQYRAVTDDVLEATTNSWMPARTSFSSRFGDAGQSPPEEIHVLREHEVIDRAAPNGFDGKAV